MSEASKISGCLSAQVAGCVDLTSTEKTPSQQGIPRLTAGALSRREPVSRLTEEAPPSSHLCTTCSCASRSRDRPSPRSVLSAPLQEPAHARYAFSSPGTELALLELISKTTMRLLSQPLDGRSSVFHREVV